jgi:hypothetical protein
MTWNHITALIASAPLAGPFALPTAARGELSEFSVQGESRERSYLGAGWSHKTARAWKKIIV